MPNLMSMEDLFYGPSEPTWIVPTPHEPRPRYIEREAVTEREIFVPAPRSRKCNDEPLRPVERYAEPCPAHRSPKPDDEPLRPVERYAEPCPAHRSPKPDDEPLRPVERYAEPCPAHRSPKPDDEPLRPVERHAEPRPAPPPIEHHHDCIRPIERLARIHTPAEPAPIHAPHEEIRKVVEVPVPVPVEVRVPVQVKVPVPVRIPIEVPVPVPAPAPPPVVAKRSFSPPPVRRPTIHYPIELKVPMCCEKCAKKVKDKLLDLEGVHNVVTDQYNQKVIVYGNADPARVLYRVKQVKKRSVFWDLTVDYSENYRRICESQAEAARADAARAESARAEAAADRADAARAEAEAAAARAESKAKLQAMQAPAVVVQLPQERNGPAVTAILPERQTAMPYVANTGLRRVRYVSPPKAYRQDFFHDPRHHQAPFYNERHADHPSSFC